MACDEIVAEELTITGSIGVVSSKFNAGELNTKLGVGVDTISKGRYAEVRQNSNTRVLRRLSRAALLIPYIASVQLYYCLSTYSPIPRLDRDTF
jgi:Peptidase family S49